MSENYERGLEEKKSLLESGRSNIAFNCATYVKKILYNREKDSIIFFGLDTRKMGDAVYGKKSRNYFKRNQMSNYP